MTTTTRRPSQATLRTTSSSRIARDRAEDKTVLITWTVLTDRPALSWPLKKA